MNLKCGLKLYCGLLSFSDFWHNGYVQIILFMINMTILLINIVIYDYCDVMGIYYSYDK